MKMFLRVLSRFIGSAKVRFATRDDLPALVAMGYAALIEDGRDIRNMSRRDLEDHFTELMETPECAVVVAEIAGDMVGMLCLAMTIPDIWDKVPTASLWFLHVEECARKSGHIALALLRAAFESFTTWGAVKVRVLLNPAKAKNIEHYRGLLGIEYESTIDVYTLRLED